MLQVSIIIKALNEERRIAACLEAALAACQGLAAEVILVDSFSTDRTVEIASAYPVRIVCLDQPAQRGCGAAVELGWRHARGQHVYVLDADMLLQPGFLPVALAYLAAHPQVAAVGGNLVDSRLHTVADHQRARQAAALVAAVAVDELGGGGLYRGAAVAQVGYLAHRALQAYEEAELGVRLRALGWALVRLPQTAVLHEGHAETDRQMLARLWANRRAFSAATFLRSALGKPWFGLVLRKLAHILIVPPLHAGALLLAGVAGWQWGAGAGLLAWGLFWLAAWGLLAGVKRSPRLALWHLFLWHYWAAGTVAGLGGGVTAPLADPLADIPAHELVGQPQPWPTRAARTACSASTASTANPADSHG